MINIGDIREGNIKHVNALLRFNTTAALLIKLTNPTSENSNLSNEI